MSQHAQDPQEVFTTAEEVAAGLLQRRTRGAEITARDLCTLLSDWGNSVYRQSAGQDIYGCEGASIRVLRQDTHPLRFSTWCGTENVVCDLSGVQAHTLIWGVDSQNVTVLAALRMSSGTWQVVRYQKTQQEFLPDTDWLQTIQPPRAGRRGDRISRNKSRGYRRYS